MDCARWLHRFRVTIVGGVVVLVAVGALYAPLGTLFALIARLLYTVLTVVYAVYALYEVFNDARTVFNRSVGDDRKVTFYTLLDATFGYILAGSLLLMLFWVWGGDVYFTLLDEDLSGSPPFLVWIQFFITAVFTSDSGLSLYIPRQRASEVVVAFYVIGARVLNAFILSMGVAVVLENNKLSTTTQEGGDVVRSRLSRTEEIRCVGSGGDTRLRGGGVVADTLHLQ